MLAAPDENARQPRSDIDRVDPRGAIEHGAQHDLSLQSRKRRADAEVCAFAKGDVPLASWPVEPELMGASNWAGSRFAAPHNSSRREPAGRSVPPSVVSATT